MATGNEKSTSRSAAESDVERTAMLKPVRDGGSSSGSAKSAGSSKSSGSSKSAGSASADSANTASGGKRSGGAGGIRKGRSRTPERATTRISEEDLTVPGGPRRVRLTLESVDPFSVMKLSFLVSIGIGIATVVAVAVLWNIVEAIGLWDQLDELGRSMNRDQPLPFMEFFAFSKFFSYGVIVAVVNVVILTALGTLLSFLYNIVARLLGGLKVTFTDD